MDHILRNMDCVEYLKTLEDNSVDLVCVDPPYFEIVKNDWDNQWKTEQEYLDWCKEWTEECFRVLKEGGCFYVWGTTKTDTFLRYKLNVLNNIKGAHYQNWIIWAYDWGGRTKKKFPRKHEDLFMYSKGKEFDFFADQILVERAVKSNMNITRKINLLQKALNAETLKKFTEADKHSWAKYKFDKLDKEHYKREIEALKKKDIKLSKGKIPTDVWTKNNHTTSAEYAGWHPTQKPIELLERIIKAHTKEGDIVLDIFSGSGSTMIAADKCGRTFRGSEFDKEYYDKSLKRLKTLKEHYNKLDKK
jgi:DNA modification methylase